MNVTYEYTITDVGRAAFNIWSVNRTRAGETEDLVYLLPKFLLDAGESMTIEEVEEIDRCVPQNFTTELDVKKEPLYQNLCKYSMIYPEVQA